MSHGEQRLPLNGPRVLLIDDQSRVESALTELGCKVLHGEFGLPYQVTVTDFYGPVIPHDRLPPHYSDSDIAIINLHPLSALNGPQGEKLTSNGEPDWWARQSRGLIDPRPRTMRRHQANFSRIYQHGGGFVVFADSEFIQDYKLGTYQNNRFVAQEDIDANNRSFLPILESGIGLPHTDGGTDIRPAPSIPKELQAIIPHLIEGTYNFTIVISPALAERWIPLATTKYGDVIAGAIKPVKGTTEGWIFILPQVNKKAPLISELMRSVLPELLPHLFPNYEGGRWIEEAPYELPKITDLHRQIDTIRREAEARLTALEKAIADERQMHGYLHDLLRATDDVLVMAVKQALEQLGFTSIVDVDPLLAETGKRVRREDLRFSIDEMTVLTEVKGIGGIPTENDVLQVGTYLAPRMREFGHTNLRGLSIVNHQRHIPPLTRVNEQVFTADTLTNAEERSISLITTWDLYRLVRSFEKNGWTHEQVRPLFRRNGRIEPVPAHYKYRNC